MLEIYDWQDRYKRTGLTPALRLELLELLSPRVRLSEPLGLLKVANENESLQAPEVKDLVSWEIVLATEDVRTVLGEMKQGEQGAQTLCELLSETTRLLHDTLDLMAQLGGANAYSDLSYVYQPSISEHVQNQDFRDWTALIELARDAWLATAEKSPERARLEAERWLEIKYPLFRRLAFFAATHSEIISPRYALDWLLADDRRWLWSIESQPESFRLIGIVAPRLDERDRERLEHAILEGPPRELYKNDVNPEHLQQNFDREIWLRLAKLHRAGAQLNADSAAKLLALSRHYPEWRLSDDDRDEFPMWTHEGDESRKFVATPKRRRDLVLWLREHPERDFWQDDDWQQRCRQDFPRAASALLDMIRTDEWPVPRWREALQAWSDEKLLRRSWRYVGPTLNNAPENVIQGLAHTLSWWLESLARVIDRNEGIFFDLIKRVLSLEYEITAEIDDAVGTAINHPIGHVTEATLRWWYRQPLKDDQKLANEIKPLFTQLCNRQVEKFRHGRILLAAHVIALFRVDHEWTTRYLLPFFELADVEN